MTDTLDSLEARAPEARERELMAGLPQLIARAQKAPGWARILDGVNAADITSRAALAQLPVTRKSDLKQLQHGALPFGGLNTTPKNALSRVFVSPGPIFDPEGRGPDWWRFARPMYAAGVRAGGLLQNCFSYHFTPAAFMVEGGAARIGCTVIPAGIGQTEMQVQAMADLKPDTYIGTPSFLKLIIEKAREMGADISSVRNAVMGAEALPESLRSWFAANGVPHVFQTYASADIGSIAYETASNGKLNPGMVIDENVLLEIVHPGSGIPVAPGEVGEVVVTVFNADYPLIRFATGDLSAVLTDAPASPCGRTNTRIKGWMGRADQTTKVRAMFVHPSQVHEIARRHPQIRKARLVVSGRMANDEMTLHCEVADPLDASGVEAIIGSIRELTKLRGDVVLVALGSLAQDGKVIDDIRDYS
ncbi:MULTISPECIES: phenylacetate--CoA ligase family protein [unclassified Janthinobacterium]|uniref:phenylacetate--CoA ligase family protein n=1 Tax=unclassified Janthinobacterium TaxID=2610881 RepID=UPI0008F46895|nr:MULTISPECIES: AMP-binding protein [unclassified Janthinobacterium]APA70729.1 AMP-dependent synthetase [Janthinobacterium sp. 1_2014MBL_MicDiv]MDN2711365.1 AMP-binding protein [Janthinobacterium sp. SUN118]